VAKVEARHVHTVLDELSKDVVVIRGGTHRAHDFGALECGVEGIGHVFLLSVRMTYRLSIQYFMRGA
jgi:hypothetical protein